jgi:hypothetical protein
MLFGHLDEIRRRLKGSTEQSLVSTMACRSLNLTKVGWPSVQDAQTGSRAGMNRPTRHWLSAPSLALIQTILNFVVVEAGSGHVRERVLLFGVHRDAVFAGHCRIDEFKLHFVADAFEVPIAPDLEREGAGLATSVFERPLVLSARGMRFDFVRLTPNDKDSAAIAFPARDGRIAPLALAIRL